VANYSAHLTLIEKPGYRPKWLTLVH